MADHPRGPRTDSTEALQGARDVLGGSSHQLLDAVGPSRHLDHHHGAASVDPERVKGGVRQVPEGGGGRKQPDVVAGTGGRLPIAAGQSSQAPLALEPRDHLPDDGSDQGGEDAVEAPDADARSDAHRMGHQRVVCEHDGGVVVESRDAGGAREQGLRAGTPGLCPQGGSVQHETQRARALGGAFPVPAPRLVRHEPRGTAPLCRGADGAAEIEWSLDGEVGSPSVAAGLRIRRRHRRSLPPIPGGRRGRPASPDDGRWATA